MDFQDNNQPKEARSSDISAPCSHAATKVKSERIFENLAADPKREDREWLDSVSAADYLRISVGSLRNLTSSGQIPYYKFGRRNRYRVSELRNLLLGQKRGVFYGN